MMKLNRKGYMLVEIVVASVLAMGIAYYLLNLTYRFKDLDEDVYQSYFYTQDKNLIVKNVMNDLKEKSIVEVGELVTGADNSQYVDFKDSDNTYLRIMLKKSEGITTFYYGKIIVDGELELENIPQDVGYNKNDVSYYERTFEQILTIGDIDVQRSNSIVTFKIPISSVYDDKDYSIKFFANISSSNVKVMPLKISTEQEFLKPENLKLKLTIDGVDMDMPVDCNRDGVCGEYELGKNIIINSIEYSGSLLNDDKNFLQEKGEFSFDDQHCNIKIGVQALSGGYNIEVFEVGPKE